MACCFHRLWRPLWGFVWSSPCLSWPFPTSPRSCWVSSLAVLLDVPVSFLESKGWPRPVTSLVLVAAAFMAVPVLVGLFLVKLWQEIQALFGPGPCGPFGRGARRTCAAAAGENTLASEWDFAGLFALPQVLSGLGVGDS